MAGYLELLFFNIGIQSLKWVKEVFCWEKYMKALGSDVRVGKCSSSHHRNGRIGRRIDYSGRTLKMCGESHWSQVKSPPTPLFTSNSWLQCKTDSGKIVPVHVRARQIPKWLDLPMESLSARTICMNADQPIAYTYRYSLFAYHIPTWTDYIPAFPVWARTEFFSMCVRVLLLGPYT